MEFDVRMRTVYEMKSFGSYASCCGCVGGCAVDAGGLAAVDAGAARVIVRSALDGSADGKVVESALKVAADTDADAAGGDDEDAKDDVIGVMPLIAAEVAAVAAWLPLVNATIRESTYWIAPFFCDAACTAAACAFATFAACMAAICAGVSAAVVSSSRRVACEVMNG
jgi:hypothetical protein